MFQIRLVSDWGRPKKLRSLPHPCSATILESDMVSRIAWADPHECLTWLMLKLIFAFRVTSRCVHPRRGLLEDRKNFCRSSATESDTFIPAICQLMPPWHVIQIAGVGGGLDGSV